MAVHPESNDKDLWFAFQQGSTEALTAIYHRHIADLYNYGARITADRNVLEDSIQDLFFKLWKQRTSLSQVSSIKFYLFKGLKSTILDNLKKAHKNQVNGSALSDAFFDFIPAQDAKIIENECEAHQEKKLQNVIQSHLTSRQKEALTLLFYDNLSYSQVAELLSLTPKSTYKLVYRALEVLRTHLENVVVSLACLTNFLFF